MFAAVIAAVAAEVYFEERFEDGGTCNTAIFNRRQSRVPDLKANQVKSPDLRLATDYLTSGPSFVSAHINDKVDTCLCKSFWF